MSAGTARVETLIDAMERLGALFRDETASLRRRDMEAVRKLSDVKLHLVRSYEDAALSIRADVPGLRSLDATARQRLREAALAFRDAMEENAFTLRAATLAAQTVVNTVVGTINRERALDQGYTDRGGMVVPAGYRRKTAPAAAVNRSC